MTKKIILRSIAGISLFFIILLIFLPLIIRKVAVKNSKEWIGRSISIKKFKLNYFTGTVKLIDFSLYESDDSTVFVEFDTLIIDTEPYRLFQNEFVLEQLYLKGLNVNVEMYDSAFNFDDLIAFHQSDSALVETDTISDKEPLHFQLSNIELDEALITARDVTLDKQMELRNVSFFVPYIGWNQEQKSEAGLKFNFKNGGYFQSNINIYPNAGDYDATLILNNLDISGYADFITKYINVGPFEGKTDIEVNLSGNIKSPEKTTASGAFVLNDFELNDDYGKPIVGVKKLKVNLKKADPANRNFVVDTIKLTEPYIYFELYDSTNNIVELINRTLPVAEDKQKTSSSLDTVKKDSDKELYYAIHSVIIENGVVDFIDSRTGKPFKYLLSDLQVTTDSITSKSTWVETQSQMSLNKRGKLVAKIGINPTNPMNVKVDYTISDFMLSDLNIYSNHYMGFPILYGDMYYKANTEIIDGQLHSENKLIIHNVELGQKSEGLHDLPLKFALFLLKDKDGVITLDIPVSGNLKDPEISVGKIVWNTCKNLVVKVAAAPVKLLSGLIGVDPIEIEVVEYDYLDTIFTEKKQKQLDLLLQLEEQKQDLEIELVYFNDLKLEKDQIAIYLVGKEFERKSKKEYLQATTQFEEYVRKKIKSDTISILNACVQLANKETVDSISQLYNISRNERLKEYLITMNDSTEISVIVSKSEAPKNIASKPVFEVKYGMKEDLIK